MRVYTVHLRPGSTLPDRDAVLVKEGFCWPAFFLSFLWALWHRMWALALVLLALEIAVNTVGEALGLAAAAQGVATLGAALAVGFIANDLRRRWLARRGFDDAGVVAAAGCDAALRRFLDAHPALSFGMGA